MTKKEFYNQRKLTFQKDYEEFRKTQKCRDAFVSVAKKNNVTVGLVNAVLYTKNYLKNSI